MAVLNQLGVDAGTQSILLPMENVLLRKMSSQVVKNEYWAYGFFLNDIYDKMWRKPGLIYVDSQYNIGMRSRARKYIAEGGKNS